MPFPNRVCCREETTPAAQERKVHIAGKRENNQRKRLSLNLHHFLDDFFLRCHVVNFFRMTWIVFVCCEVEERIFLPSEKYH